MNKQMLVILNGNTIKACTKTPKQKQLFKIHKKDSYCLQLLVAQVAAGQYKQKIQSDAVAFVQQKFETAMTRYYD